METSIPTSDQLKVIHISANWQRLLLIIPIVLAMYTTWFVVRWCIGNTIAETALNLEAAKVALNLAPDDPQAHFAAAVRTAETLLPEDLQESLRQYELSVSRSPYDYRLWMELGRARSQMGDSKGGEQAFRRSIELAPSYALPRWYFGNHLLREGRAEEAFVELRQAAEADAELRLQVFNLARRFYGEDINTITKAVGSSSKALAQLVEYLATQNRLDEALHVWTSINENDRRQKEQRLLGEKLMSKLFASKRFHAGVEVYNSFISIDEAKIAHEVLYNGSFEFDIAAAGTSQFGWQIQSVSQAQIRIDAIMAHSGKRSLRINLNASQALDLKNVSQFVLVEPSTRYQLEFYARTEELKGASTPTIEILDNAANPVKSLATSEPLTIGTKDWQLVTLEFTTTPHTEAVTIQLSRSECVIDVCPIFGKVWYDDFNLKRIGEGTAATPSSQPSPNNTTNASAR